jgi:hypothetical protein
VNGNRQERVLNQVGLVSLLRVGAFFFLNREKPAQGGLV